MKLAILNKEGKKVKEIETDLFEEPVREDIIYKVVEAEKIIQPYSSKFRAGMDRSASGNVRHRRHVWQTHYGRGMSRVPRKVMSRRGTQLNWEAAGYPGAKGGSRAHPPKILSMVPKRINKKEQSVALNSAISASANSERITSRYASLKNVKIN